MPADLAPAADDEADVATASTRASLRELEAAGAALVATVQAGEAELLASETGAAQQARELREHAFAVAELEAEVARSVQETPGFSGFFRLWRPVSRSIWVRFGYFLDR